MTSTMEANQNIFNVILSFITLLKIEIPLCVDARDVSIVKLGLILHPFFNFFLLQHKKEINITDFLQTELEIQI